MHNKYLPPHDYVWSRVPCPEDQHVRKDKKRHLIIYEKQQGGQRKEKKEKKKTSQGILQLTVEIQQQKLFGCCSKVWVTCRMCCRHHPCPTCQSPPTSLPPRGVCVLQCSPRCHWQQETAAAGGEQVVGVSEMQSLCPGVLGMHREGRRQLVETSQHGPDRMGISASFSQSAFQCLSFLIVCF